MMRRRDFMTLLGGGVVSWPHTLLAQRVERIKRIGWLDGTSGADPETRTRLEAFRRELEALGWVEGRTLEIIARFGLLIRVETGLMSQNLLQWHRT
jgi:hypothetical protein